MWDEYKNNEQVSLNDANNRAEQVSEKNYRNSDFMPNWCNALINDQVDINYPIDSNYDFNNNPYSKSNYKHINNVLPGFPTYENSNKIYQIENTSKPIDDNGTPNNLDDDSTFDLGYLYCFEYKVASSHYNNTLRKAEENGDYNPNTQIWTNREFSDYITKSFTIQAIMNMDFSINSNIDKYNVQIVSLPNSHDYNTYQVNGSDVLLGSALTTSKGDYKPLDLNEAYVLNIDNKDYKVKPGDTLNISLQGSSIEGNANSSLTGIPLNSNNWNREHKLEVKDIVYSADLLYPVSLSQEDTLLTIKTDSLQNQNSLFIFVSDATFVEIISTLLTSTEGDIETIYYEYFNLTKEVNSTNSLISFQLLTGGEYYFIGNDKFEDDFFYNGMESEYWKNNIWNSSLYIENNFSNLYEDNLEPVNSFKQDSTLGRGTSQGTPELQFKRGLSTAAFSTQISTNRLVLQVFFIFFIVIGFVISLLVVQRQFKNYESHIGVLKALGYSRSSIAFSISNLVLLILTISLIATLIFLPLALFTWNAFFSATLISSIGLYSLSLESVVFGILLPLGIFWIFGFIFIRIFYLSKSSLKLINHVSDSKPNFIMKNKIYKKLNSNLNFWQSFSFNTSTRNFYKSITIIFLMAGSSFFLLFAMSSKNILNTTFEATKQDFGFSSMGIKNINSVDNTYVSMSNKEFIESIENGAITEYTFGIENLKTLIPDPNNPNIVSQNYQQASNLIIEYMEETLINGYQYISNETYVYLSDLAQTALDQNINSNQFQPEELQNMLKGFNYSAYQNEFGIGLGLEVYNEGLKTNVQWQINGAQITQVDKSGNPVYAQGKYNQTFPNEIMQNENITNGSLPILIFMDQSSIQNMFKYYDYGDSIIYLNQDKNSFLYQEYKSIESELVYNNVDKFIETNPSTSHNNHEFILNTLNSTISNEPDGIIPFFSNQTIPNKFIINPIEEEFSILDKARYEISLPAELFIGHNNSELDITLSNQNNDPIQFQYLGNVVSNYAIGGLIIPTYDPDFIAMKDELKLSKDITNFHFLADNNNSTIFNNGTGGGKELVHSIGLNNLSNDLEKSFYKVEGIKLSEAILDKTTAPISGRVTYSYNNSLNAVQFLSNPPNTWKDLVVNFEDTILILINSITNGLEIDWMPSTFWYNSNYIFS